MANISKNIDEENNRFQINQLGIISRSILMMCWPLITLLWVTDCSITLLLMNPGNFFQTQTFSFKITMTLTIFITVMFQFMQCTHNGIYCTYDFSAKSRYLKQRWVIASHRIPRNAITYSCLRYLFLAPKSSHMSLIRSFVQANFIFSIKAGHNRLLSETPLIAIVEQPESSTTSDR